MEKVYAFKIDEEGYIIDSLVVDKGLENDDEVTIPIPSHVLYKARWTGAEWVEDKTQAEFEEDAFLSSLIPSAEEIEVAEFEIKILNILMEVELI